VEITTERGGDAVELKVKGRLDAYWADHLSNALEEAIRGGADRIRLNLAEVSYMSSVGIRVLLKFFKQLQRIKGSFVVCNPSAAVESVLQLAGLEALLSGEPSLSGAAAGRGGTGRRIEHTTAALDVFDLAPAATLRCRLVGEPEHLLGCRFTAPQCRTVSFPATAFGVGLGAFGSAFADCRGRFGEFLAAGGAAAYLPTDGSNVPDYLAATGAFVPAVQVLYALVCEGAFAQLARFEAREHGVVSLADLAELGLGIAGADAAGLVMVAESAGLVGAALRRSPATAAEGTAPFDHPQIREWLSFTPERAFPRSVALVVGVAARGEHVGLSALLRPLRAGGALAGHFHAAAFSYRPLQKGEIELVPTVSTLFEAETLEGVLHLLSDDRAISGAGQSEFVRGACWMAPITDVAIERD